MISKNGVSIIICCYNSSSRLKQTLAYIAKQNTQPNINCELIVVDNASTDDTANFAINEWKALANDVIEFKIISETKQGQSYARVAGATHAQYEYLIFCDDDNWLDENYVQTVTVLFNKREDIAILGGLSTAQLEDEAAKPNWFDKFYHSYAVGTASNPEELVHFVHGAGLAIRRSIFKMTTDNRPFLLHGRKQNQLTCGEDGEICARVRLAGYKILYTPTLTLTHFLPAGRLTWQYFKKLHAGFALTHGIIDLYEVALTTKAAKLPPFYWLKKALYFGGIFLKYWPKQYAAYSRTEGTVDELNHLTWRIISINYLKYNFKTIKSYQKIVSFKNSSL
ncbi:MAG: glycosyltransferase family 2 protein [Bacteroidota bacterium]